MVYLYYCNACVNNNHILCEKIKVPLDPMVMGGSKCLCPCNGDPLWNAPTKFDEDFKNAIINLNPLKKSKKKKK